MKKLFNASLVALAVAGTFGAQAATIASTPLQMSEQGVAAGLKALNQKLSFDIVVDKEHPAASTITLTFDKNVDLDVLACTGDVINDPAKGQGQCGDIGFDYGTGSFTFDNVKLDTSVEGAHTISFDVNLGNPVLANSAFRVVLGNHALAGGTGTNVVDVMGASSLQYRSTEANGTLIETGTGVISETTDQYAYAVETKFDGRVDREDRTKFVTVDGTGTKVDLLKVQLNDKDTLAAPVLGSAAKISIAGDFTGLAAGEFVLTGDAALDAATTVALNAEKTVLTLNVAAADIKAAGADTDLTLTFTNTTAAIPTGSFTGDVVFNGTNAYTTEAYVEATNVDHGDWALDASVVNVPYLPVGFENLSANVEYSNHSNVDAEVSITAFDNAGKTYEGDLAIAKAHTVTKYSEADIKAALGVVGSAKLNITFISDADAEDVSVVPYYRQGDSRVQTINDQYKGK